MDGLIGLLLLTAPFLFAADPLPITPTTEGSKLLLLVIPLVVPIVVAVGKFLIPKIPAWILPILAPAIGALIDFLGSLVTGHEANPITAAVLGSAGVGLRELYDQIKGKVIDKPQTP